MLYLEWYDVKLIEKSWSFQKQCGDSRYLVGIGIYFGKPKKKETFIYNSS